jgi:hypothetical protein
MGHMELAAMTLPTIPLSPPTIDRLKSYAEPLVDTWDTVVNRALDALDTSKASQGGFSGPSLETRSFNPAAPPNLSYTTVKSVTLNGKHFVPAETKWNMILIEAAREARKNMPPEKVKDVMGVNCVVGKKEEHGYKFIEDIGISIQGQDANGAWKGVFNVITAINASIDLTFSWQDNAKSAFPGTSGRFSIKALSTATGQ